MSRIAIAVTTLLVALGTATAALPGVFPEFPSDPLPGAGTNEAATVGAWGAPFEGQTPAISMVLLEDGRVLYWGGVEAGDHDQVFFLDLPHHADTALLAPPYDASSVSLIDAPPGMGDLFCAGQTILADGRVLTGGGSEWKYIGEDDTGFVDGERDAWTFNPANSSWTPEPDMANARWYPTVMTLADGKGMAVSGIQHLPQAHTLNTELETFDGSAWTTLAGADNLLPMYPRLFTVPSGPLQGDVFYATVATLWGPFGEHPLEGVWSFEQSLDLDTNTWTIHGPSLFGARQHGATVMLPLSPDDGYTGRLLTFGGSIGRSLAATNLAEMTILGADGIEHDVVPPMNHPRWHLNGVLLPDGKVLAVGGGMWDNVYAHGQRSAPVLVAEQYDPATGAWEQLAPMTVPRTYHSTALLLPDARVLVGGHVPLPVPWKDIRENMPYQEQIAETRFEIYSPPYLHWGVAQPTITSAPDAITYGAEFTVESASAATVVDAMLVHPGATTHAWDVNQRGVVLPLVDRDGDTLTFEAPPNADVAMPGPWMLFLRVQADEGLVPGVAQFVSLGPA